MPADLTDKELWNSIRDNNEEALVQLFQRYYFVLIKTGFHYVPDSELSKDAVNDVFFNLWRNRESLSDVDNVKAYLTTSFRNQLFMLVRRDLKEKDRLHQWHQTEEVVALPYEELIVRLQIEEEQKARLQTALAGLSPRQQQYLRLKFYEGLSYEQIASETGQSLKTIYNTTYEAIKALRRALTR